MKLDPSKTALVFIEFQNDFTSPGGSLHEAVRPVMESTSMLDHAVETVEKARELGVTIIHTPISFTVDTNSFRKGTWGAQIVNVLTPEPGDIVIEGKRGLCGFASTNLDFILRSRGIQNVALGGFLTNCCVESTMRTAYEKGFNVITLTDCVAATSEEEHQNAIAKDYPMFSRPMTHLQLLDSLAGKGEVADSSRGYTD
jgi:ureidoacrylate peracid hydrolase